MKVKLTVQKGTEKKAVVFITTPDDHDALHDYFVQKCWIENKIEEKRPVFEDDIFKLKHMEARLYKRLMMQAPSGWRVTTYNCVDL